MEGFCICFFRVRRLFRGGYRGGFRESRNWGFGFCLFLEKLFVCFWLFTGDLGSYRVCVVATCGLVFGFEVLAFVVRRGSFCVLG